MLRIAFTSFCAAAFAVFSIPPAVALEFPLTSGQIVVGAIQTTGIQRKKETMLDLARRFDDGYVEFMAANPGVDPWNPGVGRTITVPNEFILPDAPRKGIVANLAERRIYYFPPGGKTVQTYPVGVGVQAGMTPLGVTRVVRKEDGPVWIPPPSMRATEPDLPAIVYPGPDDPLGAYALRLGWPNYLIHGTNEPDSVGRNVSHGCLHVYPEDIARLFHEVPVGMQVRVISEPFATAWIGGRLYVAVYPSKKQADQIDYQLPMTPAVPRGLMQGVADAAGARINAVDWKKVRAIGLAATGVPTPVTPPPQELRASTPPIAQAPHAAALEARKKPHDLRN